MELMLNKTEHNYSLALELAEVTELLEIVNTKLNLTEDEDLIESLIYEELSLKARYRHILKEARQKK